MHIINVAFVLTLSSLLLSCCLKVKLDLQTAVLCGDGSHVRVCQQCVGYVQIRQKNFAAHNNYCQNNNYSH
jgi:hypothetical protein